MPFTKDGLPPFVDAPRTQYLIGQVETRCGRGSEAIARWRRITSATGAATVIWAWGAAKKLDGYNRAEWGPRLEAAAAQARTRSPYTAGLLAAVTGKHQEAWADFEQALLLPDRLMSHHLTRMAMAGVGLPD